MCLRFNGIEVVVILRWLSLLAGTGTVVSLEVVVILKWLM